MATHVFTSIIANYIPKARILAHSLKRLHPDYRFHLVLSDSVPAGFHLEKEPFDSILTIEDLGIENAPQWVFKHSIVEVSTGVKGFALAKLLELPGCSEVLYFDPDIVVLSQLDGLMREFQNASILLTPHICEPETTLEAILDNEFSVLKHGIYNLGFLGVRNTAEGRRFAHWWRDRLRDFCYDDIPSGIFTDQRWADLAPAYFDGHKILRDPVYNVCTWNLTHRTVAGDLQQGLTANGLPIVFYHFSGLDSGAQHDMLNKYGAAMPALYELRAWYLSEADRMGQQEYARIPWRYAAFDNGEKITAQHRKRYRERIDLQRAFPNPYATGDVNASYYHWFEANDEGHTHIQAAADRTRGSVLAVRPAPPSGVGQATCRVFLSAAEPDAKAVARAAADLIRKASSSTELFLAGPQQKLGMVLRDPKIRQCFGTIALPDGAGPGDAFLAALRRFHDHDLIFLRPGIILPEWGDVRLGWTARRQDGAATVSPICDASLHTALDPSRALAGQFTCDVLDALCYQHSRFEEPTIKAFLTGCVYVRAEAARAACAVWNEKGLPSSDPFRAFLDLTQTLRFCHVLADHVYAGAAPGMEALDEIGADPAANQNGSGNLPRPSTLLELRTRLSSRPQLAGADPTAVLNATTRPRQLHIMHSWGGGLEHWVREYCRADTEHENFILKSVGTWGLFGREIRLYRSVDETEPIASWQLSPGIRSTVAFHDQYRAALAGIVDLYGIERILVSSLIGHSLDALATGAATLMVCHDFYPFCPALNITREHTCQTCSLEDLQECVSNNPHNRFFRNVPPPEWIQLRKQFAECILKTGTVMVAPSNSVREHYLRFLPELKDAIRVIPHGTRPLTPAPLAWAPQPKRRLRILLPGSLAPNKGLALVQAIRKELLRFADLYLVGCGEYGADFEGEPHTTVIPRYRWEELPRILQEFEPDLALLPSVVPETFSYTLQELFELGIPALATSVGSFTDRIEDGSTGFLCAPEPAAILQRLRYLDAHRGQLTSVRARLAIAPHRSPSDMLADYEAVLPTERPSARAYFARDRRTGDEGPRGRCQLYWRTAGGSFDEADSTSATFPIAGGRHSIVLSIPALHWPPAELRLDPADNEGVLLLHGVRLSDREGNMVWCDSDGAALRGATHNQLTFLPPCDGSAGLLLWATTDDPQLLLPVPYETLAKVQGGGWLELDMECLPPEQHLRILAADVKETRTAPQTNGRGELQPVRAAALDTAQQQPARPHSDSVAKELAETRAAAGVLQRQHASDRARIEELIRDLAAARGRIAGLENSYSWRLSLPLRKVGAWGLKFRAAFRKT